MSTSGRPIGSNFEREITRYLWHLSHNHASASRRLNIPRDITVSSSRQSRNLFVMGTCDTVPELLTVLAEKNVVYPGGHDCCSNIFSKHDFQMLVDRTGYLRITGMNHFYLRWPGIALRHRKYRPLCICSLLTKQSHDEAVSWTRTKTGSTLNDSRAP